MIKEMIITYDTDDADSECDSPILKRQELVRCKNCICFADYPFGEVRWCHKLNMLVKSDWFCASGERIQNEEERN